MCWMTVMTNIPSFTMERLPQDIVIEVEFHLAREFKVRRWIATQLIKLAALVLGCGIEIGGDGEHE